MTLRWLALPVALACCLVAVPARTADPPAREAMDDAIERGLEFLKRSQLDDGSWHSAQRSCDPAVSALCVMAFLSSGNVPGEGRYGTTVEKGIRYVLSTQQRNGLFTTPNRIFEMYNHGICTLMLAEAAGMLPDPRESRRLRERLELAVKVILVAQRRNGDDRGGWRYNVQGTDSDISVTGWQLMALRAAKNLGCDVPAENVEQAVAYIKRCHDPSSGGYRYMTRAQVTLPCTGTSVLALELCGKDYHRSPEALKAGSYILKHGPNPDLHFFYGVYYTSQAMFQLGDNYWKSYRPMLHQMLLRTNPPRSNGAWYGRARDDVQFGGPNYCTAMAILALTVEYRFLPIYQRGEEPTEP